MKDRLLPALGAGLWIVGLILAITGLNVPGTAGQWMSVTGNIVFLTGLGLEGIWWVRRRKNRQQTREDQKENQGSQDR